MFFKVENSTIYMNGNFLLKLPKTHKGISIYRYTLNPCGLNVRAMACLDIKFLKTVSRAIEELNLNTLLFMTFISGVPHNGESYI